MPKSTAKAKEDVRFAKASKIYNFQCEQLEKGENRKNKKTVPAILELAGFTEVEARKPALRMKLKRAYIKLKEKKEKALLATFPVYEVYVVDTASAVSSLSTPFIDEATLHSQEIASLKTLKRQIEEQLEYVDKMIQAQKQKIGNSTSKPVHV